MKTHRENRTLAEKQMDIKNVFVQRIGSQQEQWLTTNQIAARVGMARNGRFKAMLDWMVECGTLQRREQVNPKHWPGYEYSLSEQTVKFYTRPLKINHRRNGKQVQSVEMWQ